MIGEEVSTMIGEEVSTTGGNYSDPMVGIISYRRPVFTPLSNTVHKFNKHDKSIITTRINIQHHNNQT